MTDDTIMVRPTCQSVVSQVYQNTNWCLRMEGAV